MTSILAKVNPIWSKNQCLTNSIYSPLTPRTPTVTINSTEIVNKENGSLKAGFVNNTDPVDPNNELFAIGPTNNDGTYIEPIPFTVDMNGNVKGKNLITETIVQNLIDTSITPIDNKIVTLTDKVSDIDTQVDDNTTKITTLQTKVIDNENKINTNTTEITNLNTNKLDIIDPNSPNQFKWWVNGNFLVFGPTTNFENNFTLVFGSQTANSHLIPINCLSRQGFSTISGIQFRKDTENLTCIRNIVTTENLEGNISVDKYNSNDPDPKTDDQYVPSFALTEERYALKSDIPTINDIYYSEQINNTTTFKPIISFNGTVGQMQNLFNSSIQFINAPPFQTNCIETGIEGSMFFSVDINDNYEGWDIYLRITIHKTESDNSDKWYASKNFPLINENNYITGDNGITSPLYFIIPVKIILPASINNQWKFTFSLICHKVGTENSDKNITINTEFTFLKTYITNK